MKSCFNYPKIMEPKSIEEVPNWVIVNALKCPVDAQISIVAKLLQHLDGDQRNKALSMSGVGGSLPSLDDATKVAVRISEEAITPPLDAKEQALFIAGFQECIKWLNVVLSNDR
jgi:hypothetical protein